MTLRQRIENNPTVWLLSTLLVGFLAGFGAYRTIVEVSSQIIVSKAEYERTTQTASRVPELEKQISSLKAKEGKTPSGHDLFISSLRSGELTTGKYRIRIFLNNERFEDRELLVLNN